MNELYAFLSALVLVGGCWLAREYVNARRVRLLKEENADLRKSESRHLLTIANIDALFQKAQREGIFNLGGTDSLPVAAMNNSGSASTQHFTFGKTTGPLDTGGLVGRN